MESLLQAIRKEMYAATQEATEQSFQDLQDNVRLFYSVPEGKYHRTKQLMNSPRLKEINFDGDTATGKIEIDTNSPHYDPAGRSVQEIYGYAEADNLVGTGNFWKKTKEDIEKNIEDSFGKRFK
jgi:hypothetical protein